MGSRCLFLYLMMHDSEKHEIKTRDTHTRERETHKRERDTTRQRDTQQRETDELISMRADRWADRQTGSCV